MKSGKMEEQEYKQPSYSTKEEWDRGLFGLWYEQPIFTPEDTRKTLAMASEAGLITLITESETKE